LIISTIQLQQKDAQMSSLKQKIITMVSITTLYCSINLNTAQANDINENRNSAENYHALNELTSALNKIKKLDHLQAEDLLIVIQIENHILKAINTTVNNRSNTPSKNFTGIINTKGSSQCHDGNDPASHFNSSINVLKAIDHAKEIALNKCKDKFGNQAEKCIDDMISLKFKPSYNGDCRITAKINY
jgi:hypothetical protein